MELAPDNQIAIIDGQRFAIEYDPDQPGAYHVRWLSGPDPQYGFTLRVSTHERQPQQLLTESVRSFLAHIDPDTGYLED